MKDIPLQRVVDCPRWSWSLQKDHFIQSLGFLGGALQSPPEEVLALKLNYVFKHLVTAVLTDDNRKNGQICSGITGDLHEMSRS